MVSNNSICEHLSSNSVENEIRLLLSNPKAKKETMVILEGVDDIKIFKKLLNEEDVYLFQSHGGKKKGDRYFKKIR